jgi:cysteine desulfurase / selenocysteine lyase
MYNFRKDFSIFRKEFDRKKIIYLDSAATALKPKNVIERVLQFYEHETSNIARGNHFLSELNSQAVEEVRSKTASFIKAKSDEIVFTQNATDSINLVASGLNLTKNDEVILSVLEHHSNLLPWLQKASVKLLRVDPSGIIDLKHLETLISPKTKLIALSYASNVTGNIQPVEEVIKIAKKNKLFTLIDAAQVMSHFPVDVSKLDCDFLAFSSHKMFGPSGLGILYAKKKVQNFLVPQKFGGGMANKVTLDNVTFQPFPHCFEAGTPNIEGILGFGCTIDYILERGFENITSYLNYLENYAKEALSKLDFIELFPMCENKHLPIFTFVSKNPNVNLEYITQILSDSFKVIVRGGLHCAQLYYGEMNLHGGIRVSLQIYNTKKDIDRFVKALKKIKNFLENKKTIPRTC